MLKHSVNEGYLWIRASLDIFRKHPSRWMLLALAYVIVFMVIPAINMLISLKMLVVIFGPFFMVIALTLYREADQGRDTALNAIVIQIKPQFGKLILLGLICMVYGVVVGCLTSGDSQALSEMVNANASSEVLLTSALPILAKLLILLTPILMVTWFSPMLVAHHQFPVLKAIKSSIAGCLTSAFTLTFAWVILTASLALCMMVTGILIALVSVASAALGKVLTALVLMGFMLFATALMLALNYVSYREVFAKKLDQQLIP